MAIPTRVRGLAGLLLATLTAACPARYGARPYAQPEADQLVDHLADLRVRASTLTATTMTNAFIDGERANVEVLILAAWGGRLRYQAMNPGGASQAADLASDGVQVCFLDANANCGDCGPASPENVGQLVRVALPPDGVVAAMFGSTPVIEADTRTVTWDERDGEEVLTLTAKDGSVQVIQLDGRQQRWDLRRSELRDPAGKLLWRIEHKDFHDVPTGTGGTLRLPGKSRFVQGKNDVIIDWREQTLDRELVPENFVLELPAGLPSCAK